MCHICQTEEVVPLQLNIEVPVSVPLCINSRELWRCDMRLTVAMDLLQQVREKMTFGGQYLRFTTATQLVVACLEMKETYGQKDQSSANDPSGATKDNRRSTGGIDALLDIVRGWLTKVFDNLYAYTYKPKDIKNEEFQVIVK